jgi:hypothetical protein
VSLSLLSLILSNGPTEAVDTARLSLEANSAFWFRLVKYSGYAVALGCVLEAPETFVTIKRWWLLRFKGEEHEETEKEKRSWIIPLAAIGLIMIVLGIVAETYFEGKVSNVDSDIRTHESDKITAAEGDAASAIRDAGTAKSSAKDAASASTIAQDASSTAVVLASGARKEADSLESEISSAKKQAADAVSRLADAEQRLADSTQREAAAEAKLASIKTPRSLIKSKELIETLKRLEGTEYTLNVFQDDESIQFTKSVDEVLREAGWIRRQQGTYRLGVPSFNIFKDNTPNHDESVPVCIETGVQIHVRSTKSLQSLSAMPQSNLPKTVLSAASLRSALQASIAPTEERNVGDRVILNEEDPGEGPIVICVGKKP